MTRTDHLARQIAGYRTIDTEDAARWYAMEAVQNGDIDDEDRNELAAKIIEAAGLGR